MKLSPIAIEAALAQSAGSPAAKTGPIEHDLRRALELFGPDGENWTKGTAKKLLENARVEYHAVLLPVSVVFNPMELFPQTMNREERVVPARFAYCSIGAIATVGRREKEFESERTRERLFSVLLEANRMASVSTIVQVNDLPGTEFWIIRKMFENAISYAAARGL